MFSSLIPLLVVALWTALLLRLGMTLAGVMNSDTERHRAQWFGAMLFVVLSTFKSTFFASLAFAFGVSTVSVCAYFAIRLIVHTMDRPR